MRNKELVAIGIYMRCIHSAYDGAYTFKNGTSGTIYEFKNSIRDGFQWQTYNNEYDSYESLLKSWKEDIKQFLKEGTVTFDDEETSLLVELGVLEGGKE